jgi:hypothetical protein
VYSHPNLLVHPDVRCIRELFGLLGAGIPYENPNLMIQLGVRMDDGSDFVRRRSYSLFSLCTDIARYEFCILIII